MFLFGCKYVLFWVYFIRVYYWFVLFFKGYVISRIREYAGGAPLKKKENELEIKATYVKISGQKSRYKFVTLNIKLS